jgi:putative transcriptional regulator
MRSLRGQFLVASPHLVDPNFYRSVVLMVQHDESGGLGLILNRPTGKTLRDIWSMISDEPCTCESPIFLGGPVRGPIAALHSRQDHANVEVLPGLYYTVDGTAVSEVIQNDATPYRIFIGYAGWAPGQLDSELKAGGWLTTHVSQGEVFGEAEQLWQGVSRRIGREFLQSTVKPRVVPDDPSLN